MNTLLTPSNVADRLQIKQITVVHYLRTGQLRGVKFNNKLWRVRESELEVFIEPPVVPQGGQ